MMTSRTEPSAYYPTGWTRAPEPLAWEPAPRTDVIVLSWTISLLQLLGLCHRRYSALISLALMTASRTRNLDQDGV
jgi:hypothetical protein